jgi:hypothetical protein
MDRLIVVWDAVNTSEGNSSEARFRFLTGQV